MHNDRVTGFYALSEKLQRIRGWVLNTDEPTTSQWVEILADNEVIATLLANLERPDLEQHETGYTRYGFDFLFPATGPIARASVAIAVRHKSSKTRLPSNTTSLELHPVSESRLTVRGTEHLGELEISSSVAHVAINSTDWHGNPDVRDQLIGLNGKTAQRIGHMRALHDGRWEYTKKVSYYRIPDALVIMPFGIIIANGSLIRTSLGFPHPKHLGPVLSRVNDQREDTADNWLKTVSEVKLRLVNDAVRSIDHPALLLSTPMYRGYYHWHMDVLPMLSAAEHLPQDKPGYAIGPGCPTKWHATSLNLAKQRYSNLQVDEFKELEVLRVKELIYTRGMAGNGSYLSPGLIDFYDQLHPLVEVTGNNPAASKRIYLSRRAYPRRSLENEAEIESTVESRGFQVVDPADYSYEDQIRLFGQAEFIVSPHGAALTNLLFCRAGIKVIELFADCYINLALQRLANLKHARYGYLIGTSSTEPGNAGAHDFSYSINPEALARLIDEMHA